MESLGIRILKLKLVILSQNTYPNHYKKRELFMESSQSGFNKTPLFCCVCSIVLNVHCGGIQ